MLVKGTGFVRCQEHKLRLQDLNHVILCVAFLDEFFDFLNGLDAVKSRHHEVGEDVGHMMTGKCELREANHSFLSVVHELA